MATAIERWLQAIREQYANDSDDYIVKRFSGWKGPGDTAALLYRAVEILERIDAKLGQQAAEPKVKGRK